MLLTKQLFSHLSTLLITFVIGLIGYWNTQILMSSAPYSPLGYEPAGIQLIIPGTLNAACFFLLWLFTNYLNHQIVSSNTIKKIIIFLAATGAFPSWINIYPYVWTPNNLLFWYGALYGLAVSLCLLYLILNQGIQIFIRH